MGGVDQIVALVVWVYKVFVWVNKFLAWFGVDPKFDVGVKFGIG